MFEAKVSGMGIIIIEGRTGRQIATINCSRYAGVDSVKVEGRAIRVVCKDRRTRVFDATSGRLRKTI